MAELNYIVRVIGKDLDGTRKVDEGLQGIKGISHRMGGIICKEFSKENNTPKTKKLGELTPVEVKKLEEIIMFPEKHNIPGWALNRQKDFNTGITKHLTMNDLAFSLRNDIQRMAEIKSYKGLRHMWGLTVRGQKTGSTHRGKGGVIGVAKKDAAKPGAAPAAKGAGEKKADKK